MGFLDLFGLQEKPSSFEERERSRDKEQAEIFRKQEKRQKEAQERPLQHGATKGKRDKSGAHQFDYMGVTAREFMAAMISGKYGGRKISRAGSSISEAGFITYYSLAMTIPKDERFVR